MTSIIKRGRVQVRERPPEVRAAAKPGGDDAETCEKSARPVVDRGQVVAVEVTCSCGEVTVIELEYDAAPAPPAAPEPAPAAE